GDITLPSFLGLLGAGGESLAVQQQILEAWTETAAYGPAPEYLKHQIREFLARQEPGPAVVPQPPVNQARWQAKLDQMFPGGAICLWQTGEDAAPVPVAWIQVRAMEGLDPELWFYHPFGWTKNGKVLISLETDPELAHLHLLKFKDGS